MYQIFAKTVKPSLAMGLFCLSAAVIPAHSAHAASLSATPTKTSYTKAALSGLKGAEVNTIDWRQPTLKLSFDLTQTDWIDGIELQLTVNANGARKNSPLLVSLNNGPAVTLRPRGSDFDARIRLDSDYARPTGNVISIRYPAPDGQSCLRPGDGGFTLKAAQSSIIVRTRPKRRNTYLDEVEARLSNPVLAPKTVAITATGSDAARLEMLAAQGIGLRMKTLPTFRVGSTRGDMRVIMGRRDTLSKFVTDEKILNASGSKVSVHAGRPMRLVITGDTDAQVLSAAKLFSQRHLPRVHRAESAEGEMRFQRAFADKISTLSGKTKLSDIGYGYYARDWASAPSRIDFRVDDPAAHAGRVKLRFGSSDKIADQSTFDVALNGRSLGQTQLNKRRKTVAFDIPQGALASGVNALTLTPRLVKSSDDKALSCPGRFDAPGLYIDKGSRIELFTNAASPITELSTLTSGSGAFSAGSGANTHVILASRKASDRAASLRVLAKLAKSGGTSWANATVSNLAAAANFDTTRNVLVIGPDARRTDVLDGAPRAFTAALRGQAGPAVAGNSTREKFASLDARSTVQIYAARQAQKSRSRARMGGVAAIFPSADRPDTLTGVITTAPGYSFARNVEHVMGTSVWNDLSGSVSRWNRSDVLMAQAPLPAPNFKPYRDPDAKPRFKDAPQSLMALLDTTRIEDGLRDLGDRFDAAKVTLSARLSDMPNRFAKAEPAAPTVKTTATQKVVQSPAIVTKPSETSARILPPAIRQTRIKPAVQSASVATPPPALRGFSTPDMTAYEAPKPSRFAAVSQTVKGWFAPRRPVTRFVPPAETQSKTQREITPAVEAPKMRAPKIKRVISEVKAPVQSASNRWNMSRMEHGIRNIQSKVAPIGTSIKRRVQAVSGSEHNPFRTMAVRGDRAFGMFGFLLILGFILSVLGLGLASASSEDTKHY